MSGTSIVEGQMFHRRAYWPELIEDLCCGCHLPVKVPTCNMHVESIHPGPFVGTCPLGSAPVVEREFGTAEPEILRRADNLLEAWNKKCEPVEENDPELLEKRKVTISVSS